jgi:hypothetical protein
MASTTCPRCGFVQDGGTECQRCGVIFARARQASAAAPPPERPRVPPPSPVAAAPRAAAGLPDTPQARPGVLRRAYRIFRWVTLAGLAVVLFLLLRTDRPPEVAVDPQGAARVDAKRAEMEAAAARGVVQPLALDEGELNDWLVRNLALAPGAGAAEGGREPSVEEVRSNVRDVKVKLIEDRVRLWALFDFHGKDMTLTLEGRLHVEGGILRLDATDMWFASLPVPHAALKSAVNRIYSDPANLEKFRVPPDIADIQIVDGRLIVTPAVRAAESPARFYVPGTAAAPVAEAPTEGTEQSATEANDSSPSTPETVE